MASLTEMDYCLSGCGFPAGSGEIAECTSRSLDCSPDAMEELGSLPPGLYISPGAVLAEISGDRDSTA